MMNIFKEHQVITVEKKTEEDRKTGLQIITAVSFKSSNGLFYKLTNLPKSNSKTNIFLSFNGKILINGNLNASAYRADSFMDCKDHVLFKLSKEEVIDFLKKHEKYRMGTLFIKNGSSADISCLWLNKKIHYLTEEDKVGEIMQGLSPKHRSYNVMEKFLHSGSRVKETVTSTNIKGNLSLFKMMDDTKSYAIISTYDNDTHTGMFKLKGTPKRIIEGLTLSKYKVMLNDYLIKWAINNPKGNFETLVNDFGFTDDMSYNQVKKMIKMIKI